MHGHSDDTEKRIIADSLEHFRIKKKLFGKGITLIEPKDKSVTDVIIPSEVTAIASGAFSDCKNLRTAILPPDPCKIGDGIFSGCSELRKLEAPVPVTVKGKALTLLPFGYYFGKRELSGYIAVTQATTNETGYKMGEDTYYIPQSFCSLTVTRTEARRLCSTLCGLSTLTELSINTAPYTVCRGELRGLSSLESLTLQTLGVFNGSIQNDETSLLGYIFGADAYYGATRVTQMYKARNGRPKSCAYYIPSLLRRVTVTSGNIGKGAFSGCSDITEINLPSELTALPDLCFKGCHSLSEIKIPKCVTVIGAECFHSCRSLRSPLLPKALKEIKKMAFHQCASITSLKIPEAVKKIGDHAFCLCESLTDVSFPSSVCELGASLFSSCKSISRIELPNTVTVLESDFFNNCSSLSVVKLPEGLAKIEGHAFSGCSELKELRLPASLSEVSPYAFSGASALERFSMSATGYVGSFRVKEGVLYSNGGSTLEFYPPCREGDSFRIPNSVTSISRCAFDFNKRLCEIIIGGNLMKIDGELFKYCYALEKFTVSEENRFYRSDGGVLCDTFEKKLIAYPPEKKDESFTVPSYVETVCGSAFASAKHLKRIIVYSNVKRIEGFVGGYNSILEAVVKPGYEPGVVSALNAPIVYVEDSKRGFLAPFGPESCPPYIWNHPKSTLDEVGRAHVVLGEAVYTGYPKNGEAELRFLSHSAEELVIPERLKLGDGYGCVSRVNQNCFYNHQKLERVTISSSVEEIGGYRFLGCHALSEINVNANNPYFCSDGKLLYSADRTTLYAIAPVSVGERLVIEEGVTCIAEYAASCSNILCEVVIPDSVKEIEPHAFNGCSKLTEIKLGRSVASIGDGAFNYCGSLTAVYMSASVKSFGLELFGKYHSDEIIIYFDGTESEWKDIKNSEALEKEVLCVYYNDAEK